MSYARWTEGDVYVYYSTAGHYICMDCHLVEANQGACHTHFTCAAATEMIDHVQEHIDVGDAVPARAIPELLVDTEDGLSQGDRFRKALAGVPS